MAACDGRSTTGLHAQSQEPVDQDDLPFHPLHQRSRPGGSGRPDRGRDRQPQTVELYRVPAAGKFRAGRGQDLVTGDLRTQLAVPALDGRCNGCLSCLCRWQHAIAFGRTDPITRKQCSLEARRANLSRSSRSTGAGRDRTLALRGVRIGEAASPTRLLDQREQPLGTCRG